MGTLHSFAPPRQVGDSAPVAELADDGAQWGKWMARAQAGDQAVYQALLRAVVPYVAAIARRYLGNRGDHKRDDVDDAVQEVLIVLHDIRHTYEPSRPFKPWLATIAARRCIDLSRQRTRHARRELYDEAALLAMHDPGASPEDALALRQRSLAVHRAVARLSPRMRDAVQRVHLQDQSLDLASLESGQTSGAIKVACHRALKSLRTALGTGTPP
ncbi:MAG: sigma-70 family RNA polymerase sigma factor [Luteimonas sp.]